MFRRVLLVIAAFAIAGLSGAGVISVAAAAFPASDQASTLAVSGNEPWAMPSLMPGDRLPDRVIRVSATGCLRYWVTPSIVRSTQSVTGSRTDALARWLHVRATVAGEATPLYDGHADGDANPLERTLCDGAEDVRLDGDLELAATNDVQGATGALRWTVTAVELAEPAR